MARRVNQRVAQPTTPRDYATVARFFADLELVPPGVAEPVNPVETLVA
jgi:hypothetical protein